MMEIKKKKFNKKNLIWIIPFFVIVLVSAAWLFTVEGGFSMVVESIPGYTSIALDAKSFSVNTTGSASTNQETLSFILNKDMKLYVEIIETFQDNSGGTCFNGTNDCTLVYQIYNDSSYHVIEHGKVIGLSAMPYERNITAILSCVAYSCPQSITSEITLTEVIS